MTFLGLIVALIVVGVALWLINNFIPMDPKIKTLLNVIVVLAVVLWILNMFHLLGPLNYPVR